MWASHIVYRIAWHISDPKSYFNFALVCKKFAAAAKYWERPKMTEFSISNLHHPFKILPNGVFHGPSFNHNWYINKGYWSNMERYSFICGDYEVCCVSNRVSIMHQSNRITVTLCKCGGFNYEIKVGERMTHGRHGCPS